MSGYVHSTEGYIRPIKDHVLVNEIEDTGERIVNGIIVLAEEATERGIRPRWAKVSHVGPEQTNVKPGQWVLISHGRWTRGVKLSDGKVYRKIDHNDILLISDTKPKDVANVS